MQIEQSAAMSYALAQKEIAALRSKFQQIQAQTQNSAAAAVTTRNTQLMSTDQSNLPVATEPPNASIPPPPLLLAENFADIPTQTTTQTVVDNVVALQRGDALPPPP